MDSFRRRLMAALAAAPDIPYVDLGLPSGLLWAQYNIGATVPEGYGEYFSWGNIVGHKAGSGYDFSSSKYNKTPGSALTADILPDDIDHDAALVSFGNPWRLPTKENFQELYVKTDRQWTTINNVSGYKFMKKTDNSVYIFLAAAGRYNGTSLANRNSNGYYWSSCINATTAYYMLFLDYMVNPQDVNNRYYGMVIRPVRYPEMEYVDLGLPSGMKWATCNLGASTPEAAGMYFSWGNVVGHIMTGSGYNFSQTNYNNSHGSNLGTQNIPVNSSYDAAQYMLGDKWRLPTKAEGQELIDNTINELGTLNGVNGMFFYKKDGNGQKIADVYVFFPFVGGYDGMNPDGAGTYAFGWTSSYMNSTQSWYLRLSSSVVDANYYYRYLGFPIRSVYDPSLL